MQEIMILRKNVDNETRLKIFQVDDDNLAKLTRIRGNLFKDDSRLKLARDLPTPEPEPKISPERQAWLDGAYAKYLASQAVTPAQPQPERTRTTEEEWRTRPDIRAEFVSLASYEAYCKAIRDGRTKLYGCKS